MYEIHFHLRRKPFDLLPDPEFLFPSGKHKRALSLLEYGLLDQAGFIVVTGPAGTGKTTLIRHLLDMKAPERQLKVAVIFNTQVTPGEFLEPVLEAYGLPYQGKSRTERLAILREFLRKEVNARNQVALIIDEAQNLPFETLEEIRLLSNIGSENKHHLQLVLVGQPGLRTKLSDPRMLPFAQRVTYDYHLHPLDTDEVHEYVRHRLRVAGARDPDLFSREATDSIHQHSKGIPRLVNLICHMALVYGFADQIDKIGKEVIEEVVKDWEVGRHLQILVKGGADEPPPLQIAASIPGDEDWIAEIRRSIEEIRLDQEHLFRTVEALCSDDRDPEAPIWLQSRREGKPTLPDAKAQLDDWSRIRALLKARYQEIRKYQEKIRALENEIESLRGRKA